MAQKKYYVVWKGRKTGIFESWNDCKKQISEFQNAVYKSFTTRQLAEQAFASSSNEYVGKTTPVIDRQLLATVGKPIMKSIAVDGAWNTATGVVEYQGVETDTKKILFKMGPFADGTNNIVEFLGIVHALAYCKQNNSTLPIYSDSRTAMAWVRDKNAKTQHPRRETNAKLFDLLDRAVKWLNENDYKNKILKWETQAWGETPADFGRK